MCTGNSWIIFIVLFILSENRFLYCGEQGNTTSALKKLTQFQDSGSLGHFWWVLSKPSSRGSETLPQTKNHIRRSVHLRPQYEKQRRARITTQEKGLTNKPPARYTWLQHIHHPNQLFPAATQDKKPNRSHKLLTIPQDHADGAWEDWNVAKNQRLLSTKVRGIEVA